LGRWLTWTPKNKPAAQFWEPLILPPDFASVNLSSAAMSYYKPADGNEWLAIGAHGLLLRTKEPAASPQTTQGGLLP